MANYRSVRVPADALGGNEVLIEGRVGDRSTGLCRTIEEAQDRAAALEAGCEPATSTPHGQIGLHEMPIALAWIRAHHSEIRGDSRRCLAVFEAAAEGGIGCVEWAIASRYVAARWVPCK